MVLKLGDGPGSWWPRYREQLEQLTVLPVPVEPWGVPLRAPQVGPLGP